MIRDKRDGAITAEIVNIIHRCAGLASNKRKMRKTRRLKLFDADRARNAGHVFVFN